MLQDWTAAAAPDDRRAGRRARSARSNGIPEAPPDDTGEAIGLPPSGLTLTIGFGPTLFRDADGKDRFGLADQPPGRAGRAAALPRRRARAGDLRRRHRASRPARTTRRSRCTPSATWPGSAWAWSACAGRSSASGGRRRPRTGQATPRNLFGFKDGTNEPQGRGDRPAARARLGAAGRRAGLDGRRLVPGHPQDPDADRDLGPDVAGRAGGDRRPAQGQRRAARPGRRVRRARLRRDRRRRRAADRRRPRTSGWPTRATTTARGCCAGATTSSTAPTGSAGWTPGCSSSPTSATRGPAVRPGPAQPGRADEMNEYIRHVSSGLFACPPGVKDGDDYWGRGLFAA